MPKFRILSLIIVGCLIAFSIILLSDGIYRLSRSDMQTYVVLSLISSFVSFACILFLKPSETASNYIKDNVLILWIKRKKLEEQKRIKDLEDQK